MIIVRDIKAEIKWWWLLFGTFKWFFYSVFSAIACSKHSVRVGGWNEVGGEGRRGHHTYVWNFTSMSVLFIPDIRYSFPVGKESVMMGGDLLTGGVWWGRGIQKKNEKKMFLLFCSVPWDPSTICRHLFPYPLLLFVRGM